MASTDPPKTVREGEGPYTVIAATAVPAAVVPTTVIPAAAFPTTVIPAKAGIQGRHACKPEDKTEESPARQACHRHSHRRRSYNCHSRESGNPGPARVQASGQNRRITYLSFLPPSCLPPPFLPLSFPRKRESRAGMRTSQWKNPKGHVPVMPVAVAPRTAIPAKAGIQGRHAYKPVEKTEESPTSHSCRRPSYHCQSPESGNPDRTWLLPGAAHTSLIC
jgi:hypothetical protein